MDDDPDRLMRLSDMRALQQVILSDLNKIAEWAGKVEARMAKLERARAANCGPYDRRTHYQPGDTVTHAGHRWRATVVTKGVEPGDGALWTKCG